MKNSYHLVLLAPLCLLAAPTVGQEQTPAPEAGAPVSVAPDPADAPTANWFETRVAIEELADTQDFAAAIALGDRLLELAEQEFGATSAGLAEAHLLLADVHRRAGAYQAAEQEILLAIDVLEATNGPLSPTLIDPFIELGGNYEAAGDFPSAIAAYDEARFIGRRNFGLLNLDQLALIDRMAAAADELGQIQEAMELKLEKLTLIERIHEETSLEAIEARLDYARWLREHNLYEDEQRLYFQLERMIEEHHGDDPLLHVRVLRERAASFRAADTADAFGLAGLRDAVEYLQEMPDPPPLLMASVLTEIGDWLVEFSRTTAIAEEYIEAWQLLGRVEDGEALRKQWFEDLNAVEISNLSRRGLSTDANDPLGFVTVYFTVDTDGRTRDIEVTDSEPEGLKDTAVIRLMRDARFRPRIIDGEIVPTRRAYRFEFRYEPVEDSENSEN